LEHVPNSMCIYSRPPDLRYFCSINVSIDWHGRWTWSRDMVGGHGWWTWLEEKLAGYGTRNRQVAMTVVICCTACSNTILHSKPWNWSCTVAVLEQVQINCKCQYYELSRNTWLWCEQTILTGMCNPLSIACLASHIELRMYPMCLKYSNVLWFILMSDKKTLSANQCNSGQGTSVQEHKNECNASKRQFPWNCYNQSVN
jgi:hypothetical protein